MAKPDYSKLFAKVEKQYGLAAGTLDSIRQQETGGQSRFDADPAAFHYLGANPKSSARGLFGVVKGTARDPGYGVKPLTDWSPESQAHFAASYLQALQKKTGSLEGGLAAYGEGPKYAKQVVGRLKGDQPSILAMPDNQMPQMSDLPMAQAPVAAPPVLLAQAPVQQALQEAPMMAAPTAIAQQIAAAPGLSRETPWAALGQVMPSQAMSPADINYGNAGQVDRQQAAMSEEEFSIAQANNAERTQSILQKFGLGKYSQGLERYQATVPEFTRTA